MVEHGRLLCLLKSYMVLVAPRNTVVYVPFMG